MRAKFELRPMTWGRAELGPVVMTNLRLVGGSWSSTDVRALVDTGASICVASWGVGTSVLGMTDAMCSSGVPQQVTGVGGITTGYMHDVDVRLVRAGNTVVLERLRVVFVRGSPPYDLLLGQRDVLDRLVFVQNGLLTPRYFVVHDER